MAQIKADEISQILREQIANYDSKVRVDEVGTIISLGDGIARIHGLDKAMAGELLAFPHGIAGLAMSLEEDQVGAVLLGDYTELSEGNEVKRTGKIQVPGNKTEEIILEPLVVAGRDVVSAAMSVLIYGQRRPA